MGKEFSIWLPCSPSKVESVRETTGLEFVLSWGGGMGGSTKTVYADKLIPTPTEKQLYDVRSDGDITFINAKTNEEEVINSKFVVTKRQVKLVKVLTDITAWKNLSERNEGDELTREAKEERLYAIPMGVNHNVRNEYKFDSTRKNLVDTKTILNGKTI